MLKVLIADDDRDQLDLRSLLLRKNGFETFPASEVESALRKAKVHKPDCAVIDLRFPTEASGLELIRNLKALDSRMHVFVLTGSDARSIARCQERKLIDEILVKGSSSRYLVERLNAIAAQSA